MAYGCDYYHTCGRPHVHHHVHNKHITNHVHHVKHVHHKKQDLELKLMAAAALDKINQKDESD